MIQYTIYLVLVVFASTLAQATTPPPTPPRCPVTAADVASLNPLTACLVSLFRTPEQAKAYIESSNDEACIAQKNSCATGVRFNKCQLTTNELMRTLFGDQDLEVTTCSSMFKGLEQYCDRPFGELGSLYCPDPPLLPAAAIGGIVGGGIFLGLLCCFVCWRTRRSILLDEEIAAAVGSGATAPGIQPAGGGSAFIDAPQTSSYIGVEWNHTQGGWDAIYATRTVREWLGTFSSQEQAARKYDQRVTQLMENGVKGLRLNFPEEQQSTMKSSNPAYINPPPKVEPPPVVKPQVGGDGYDDQFRPQTSNFYLDPDRERHMQELIHFYQVYDPDRPNVEEHVRELFDKYRFKGIARAILRKYGVLPSGWASEYDATRSIAMSMAARLFSPSQTQSAQVTFMPANDTVAVQRDQMPDF